jgi:hypothetical protein
MDEAKFHEFEVDLPFGQAISKVRRIMGNSLYYLHNQAGGHDWCVRHVQGRVTVHVRDPRMATFVRLKL